MLTTIDFRVRPVGLLDVAALSLDHVSLVRPKLQVPAAELAFLVFLVAGALPSLLDLDLVVGKLWNIVRAGSDHFTSCQRTYPSFERPERRRIRLDAVIVTETAER